MSTTQLGIKLSLDGATQAEASLRRVSSGLDGVGQSAASIKQSLAGLAGAFAGVVSVREFVQAADAVTQLQNNLRLATGSAQAAGVAYEQLFAIAQRSRTNFAELGNTFASIARASESLGLSQQALLGLTETIGNAVTVSGASAQASQAALMQLGQGLASGTLRGEELNSILEQTPRLAKALADGLGVSTGALRKLGEQGKLTAEAVVQALRSQQGVLAEEVQTSVTTVSQAFTQLKNAATVAVGDFDRASGSTGALATGIQAVATTIGDLRTAFSSVADTGQDFTAFGEGVGAVMRTITLGATTTITGIQQLGIAVAGLAAAGTALATGGGLSGARDAIKMAGEDIDRLGAKWQAQADAILNSAGTVKRASEINAQATARMARQGNDAATAIKPLNFRGLVTGADGAKKAIKELGDEFASQREAAKAWASQITDFQKIGAAALAEAENMTRAEAALKSYLESAAYLEDVATGRQNEVLAAAALALENERLAASTKAVAAAEKERAQVEQALLDAQNQSTASVVAKLQGLKDEEAALVIAAAQNISLAQAIEEVEIARLREQQAALMRTGDRDAEVLAIQAEIDARKKLKDAIGSKEARDASAQTAKDAAEEWKRASQQIEQSLTDALMRGFESGKDMAQVLRDTIVNMFKTLVLRPIISAVVNPVAGALTGSLGLAGAANAGQGGNLLGTASNLSSAYDALSNGVSNAVSAGFDKLITNGVGEKLGLSYYNGTGYESTGTGAQLGGYAGMAGNALAGYGLQKAISGGYKTGESGLVDAITVAASAYFGPIAGVAAGAFNRAFGRKLTDQGLQGQFGGDAGFTGENYQFLKGGWFRSDKTKTSALDADMQSGLADQFKALQVQTALMATVLGDTGQSVADFASSIKLSFNGLTEAQIGEKLAETFAGIANDLAKTVLGDSAFAKEGEAASQTLQRLANSLTTVNGTFDALGFSLQAVSLAGADAASDFIDLIGGLDAFKAATAGYYANFYTEAERQGIATEQLTAQLAGLGQAMPATRDGFRALVEAAEKAGDNALLAGLLNLQDEFAALVPAAEDAAAAVASSVKAMDAETKRLQRQLIEAQGGDLVAFDTEGMSVAERAAYAYNQSLQAQIDATNAAKNATDTLADTQQQAADTAQQAAADTLSAWQDAQRNMAQGWLDGAQAMENARYEYAQRELDAARAAEAAIATARTSAAQASIDAVSGIAGALRSAREALTGAASQPLTKTSYGAARGLIDQAAATGNLGAAGLEDALKVVSGNTQSLFGRFEDWAMAQAAAAEPVAKLDAQAQGQMAAAQAIIDTMRVQEEEAALRYAENKRVLGDNHSALMDSLQMQYDAQIAQIEATQSVGARFDSAVSAMTAASAASSGGGGSSASGSAALIAAISQLSNQMGITYSQAESVMAGYTNPAQYVGTGNSTYGGIGTAPSGSAQDLLNQVAYNAGNQFETTYNPNGGYDLNKTFEGYKELFPAGSFGSNYSVSGFQSYMNAVGYQGANTPEATELLKKWGAAMGLPAYAVGTPYVPEDGPAYLHKGEMVVPAAYNPNATGYRQADSNAAVVAELRTLNERTEQNESLLRAIVGFVAGTDRKLARVIKTDAITTETA